MLDLRDHGAPVHDDATLLRLKRRVHGFLNALPAMSGREASEAIVAHMAPDMVWNGQHPVNTIIGAEAWATQVRAPLMAAFPDLERRDDIFLCSECLGAVWISATGHYVGTFAADYLGIPATGQLATLRFGEFYKLEGDRIVETYVLWDLVDLMRQAGVNPMLPGAGVDGYSPSPMTQDGVDLTRVDREGAARTWRYTYAMWDGLRAFDGRSLESMGMERYWHAQMMWYGPTGIGANRGVKGFQDFHQRPFLVAFPDRRGGNHKARVGDGAYSASIGWPSVSATHTGPYLGVPATNKPITMRVMDWWRLEGEWLRENWVFIDLPELFLQFGRDLFADMNALARNRGKG